MSEFIKILLSLSLSGTLLMLLVLLPKPLYRERFSRRWQYYIWLVVALRFLLPLTPDSTFTGYLFARMEAALLPDIAEHESVSGIPAAISDSENNVPVLNGYPDDKSFAPQDSGHTVNGSGRTLSVSGSNSVTRNPHNTDSSPEAGETEENRHNSVRTPGSGVGPSLPDGNTPGLPNSELWLFGIWLTGASILLIRKITLYQNFLHFLKAGSMQVSDIETLNLLSGCAERLNVKRRIELCTNSMLSSPIMVGFFRPCILLPAQEIPGKCFHGKALNQEYLYYIFTHELIHYKRRDMFYKWFIQLVLCIHWFNPFVYRLGKETGCACELACDEAVTASLDDTEKRAYGNTLLAFLRADSTYKTSAPYVTLTEGAKNLKERLGAIMKSGKKSKYMTYVTAIVTLVICVGFTALGAYAKSGSDTLSKNTSSKTPSSTAPGNIASGNTNGSNGSSSENDSSAASLAGSSCEYDNGVCYIYIDGSDLSSKPLTGFTEGTLGIVLVQKDGYTSLGPFDPSNADIFREQLTQTCENMVKNNILTRKNADIILAYAEDIVEKAALPTDSTSGTGSGNTSGYTFVNRGFYQDSYIVEMGWNLSGGGQMVSLAKRVPIAMGDGSEIGVYFADSAENYAEDADVLKAIGNLITSLRKDNLKGYPDLERPLISRVRKVAPDNLPSLAKEYLEEDDLMGFSAVFSALPASEQQELCQTLYENSDTSFFVSVIPFMEEDMLLSFLDKAQQDGNISFSPGSYIPARCLQNN